MLNKVPFVLGLLLANVKAMTLGSHVSVTSDEYFNYGNQCADEMGECENCEFGCFYSWPTTDADRWDSAEADCRCLPFKGVDPEITYHWGDFCEHQDDGVCGECNLCIFSWPENDANGHWSE